MSINSNEPIHDISAKSFASDNYSGIHPEILNAILVSNGGHSSSYGNDPYTAKLQSVVKDVFGSDAVAFPTLTGTGSNVIALHALLERHQSVICAATAHVVVDEGGAPERAGIKLLLVDTPDGKLTPELIDRQAWGFGDQHRAQPGVVSITQSTELGTLYSLAELRAIAEHAHAKGMKLHMDGARVANAAVSLGVSLKEMTTDVGVDILSFGGTKNGAMLAEAVIVLNSDYAGSISYLRKGSAQLGSKMRFISAQLIAILSNDLWRRNAEQANYTAKELSSLLSNVDGVEIIYPTQANAVFALIAPAVTKRLLENFNFYIWDEGSGLVRWMTSWDTTEADVAEFVAAVQREIA
jgi:threonine aldolase